MRRALAIALLFAIPAGCDSGPESSRGPGYPGAGIDYQPMPTGSAMHCFYGEDDPNVPAATIEHVLETFQDLLTVHVRLTLDPRFVDNTYGAGSIGWGDRGHSYKQLDGSDHAQLLLYDGNGDLVLDFAMDYITDKVTEGVRGGDGDVSTGQLAWIVGTDTSLSKNLNVRGYGQYDEDSPLTDDTYQPNPAAPDWDYRVVYEAWIANTAFGAAGFGSADVEYIHASPAKADDNTIIVDPDPCPPDWDPDGECNDPDGCDPDPGNPDGECNDPDGCNPDPGGDSCRDDDDCAATEFCSEDGRCLPDVG